jgi:predicted outer membrane repeat protein
VYVVNSRFTDNACSNGAALSSIGVSWTVLNSRFVHNRAIGTGANPARSGTPGGGSGGAIYNDGNRMMLTIGGCLFTDNHANEGGGAIFFVSNDRSGTMAITDSTLERNPNERFHTPGLPGIYFLGARRPTITRSVVR